LIVTKPSVLATAERIAHETVDAVELACSRFRPDSELSVMQSAPRNGAAVEVSPLLADLVRAALWAAALTEGSVDPTLGNDLLAIGYDQDIARLDPPADGEFPAGSRVSVLRRSAGWRRIGLDGDRLSVPDDLRLDLGASAKAFAADRIAARIADELGCGVLISLGGDIATAGPAIDSHWEILVQDTPADPAQQVALPAGLAMATSSTRKRRWSQSGMPRHHILDPQFGLPVEPVWRSATVAAPSCLRANALSTAAIVRGTDAPAWLAEVGADARLVDRRGRVVTTGNWPAEEAQNSMAVVHE
jgi:thiamine biosynthesis lipoprotein